MHIHNRLLALIGLIGLMILVFLALLIVYWKPDVCAMVVDSFHKTAFPLFLGGASILVVVLLMQWWTVTNIWRINKIPLSEVERMHPHLPSSFEIIITLLLSIVLATLFLQFGQADVGTIFSLSSSTSETKDSREIVVADFDLDGDLDFVVSNFAQTNELYLNSGTGMFTLHSTYTTDQDYGFAAGDVDRDGDIDLVHIEETTLEVVYNQYANSSSGFIRIPCSGFCLSSSPIFNDITLGDVDNDADLDIVLGRKANTNANVYLNNGTGAFTSVPSRYSAASAVALGGFNNDPYLDLALITTGGGFQFLKGSGTGGFTPVQTISGSFLGVIAVGDVNADGTLDVVSANNSQQLYLFSSSSTGSFSSSQLIATSMANIKSVALGDINNDGYLDILAAGNASGGVDGGVSYYLNDGSGGFSTEYTNSQASDNTDAVGLGDLDNDGDLDYIRANRSTGVNRVYLSSQADTSANANPAAPSTFSTAITYPPVGTGSTFASDSATGSVAWSNASNVGVSDNAYATASLTSSGTVSEYLKVTNLGFRIATGATILGIGITVERKASATSSIRDKAVRLVKDGSIQSTDKASATAWQTSDTSVSYGGATDLWGGSWAPIDINNNSFGVVLSATSVTGGTLTASIDRVSIAIYTDQTTVIFNWGEGSDAEAPSASTLQYQLRLGTGSTTDGIHSSKVASPLYASRVLSDSGQRAYTIRHLPCGETYYWSVQTVDAGLKGSTFSAEQTVTIPADCASFSVGGSSGGSDPNPGGGWIWQVINPTLGKWGGLLPRAVRPRLPGSNEENGTLTIRTFIDVNRNGMKDPGERYGLSDYSIRVSSPDTNIPVTNVLTTSGETSFSLPPSSTGYDFEVLPPDGDQNEYFVTSDVEAITLASGEEKTMEIGVTYAKVLQHFPCLRVRSRAFDEDRADAVAFLESLDDIYGKRLLEGIDTSEILVSRKTFFTLLQRMQCVPTVQSLQAAIAESNIEFADIQPESFDESIRALYSLAVAKVPVAKVGLDTRYYADLETPVTRSTALSALHAAMDIPTSSADVSSHPLPVDLPDDHPLAKVYAELDALGVVPQSMRTVVAADRGMTLREAATLLSRAAFVMGRVSLLSDIRVESDIEELVPTFLTVVPEIREQPCIQIDRSRTEEFRFSDIYPDHPFHSSLQKLLQYNIENNEGEKMWLVTGTNRLTELGVREGTSLAHLDTPVSAIDTLRTLLILTCRPPLSVAEVDQGPRLTLGSIEQLSGDKLFGLPQSSALEWRIAVRAQRPDTFGNFSLFSMAKKLLTLPDRSPYHPFSVEEASLLFGSVLAMTAAEQGVIPITEAGNRAHEASVRISEDLMQHLSQASSDPRLVPLTRGMLLYYASVILEQRFEVTNTEQSAYRPSLPELWFARIMR